MKVTISTPGHFPPAYIWGAYLEERGQLERVVTSLPYERVRKYGLSRGRTRSYSLVAVWNSGMTRLAPARLQQASQRAVTATFDRLAARALGRCDAFNGWTGASLESIRTARRRGIPTVLQTGSAHIVTQDELLKREADKFGQFEALANPHVIMRALREYEEADAIVVPSTWVRRTFLEKGIPSEKLFLVPWAARPVTEPQGQRARARDRVRILFVGSSSLRKGIPYLLEAARLVGHEAEFHLVGRPNDALYERLGGLPSNTTAVGMKGGTELGSEFDDADIFVLPSIEDGSALVTIEAMLAGLPVVVSDQAGAALLEDGVNGYEVPAGDSGALAERMLTLIRDESLRARMGSAARDAASPRTPAAYGEELSALVYRPLLAEATAG